MYPVLKVEHRNQINWMELRLQTSKKEWTDCSTCMCFILSGKLGLLVKFFYVGRTPASWAGPSDGQSQLGFLCTYIRYALYIQCILVRFRCKIVKKKKNVIFSHVDICFEKTGFKEQTMVYVRKSCLLLGVKAGEIPFVPTIFLCLKCRICLKIL